MPILNTGTDHLDLVPWNPLVLPDPGRPVPVGPARALGQPAHRPYHRHCHCGSHQGRHQVP